MRLVLDGEAVAALLTPGHPGRRRLRWALGAAHQAGRDATVPTASLAGLYLRPGHNGALEALLAEGGSGGLLLRDTDRELARLIGVVLADGRGDPGWLEPAHLVAVALEGGGGLILTGDPARVGRLSRSYRSILVEAL